MTVWAEVHDEQATRHMMAVRNHDDEWSILAVVGRPGAFRPSFFSVRGDGETAMMNKSTIEAETPVEG